MPARGVSPGLRPQQDQSPAGATPMREGPGLRSFVACPGVAFPAPLGLSETSATHEIPRPALLLVVPELSSARGDLFPESPAAAERDDGVFFVEPGVHGKEGDVAVQPAAGFAVAHFA